MRFTHVVINLFPKSRSEVFGARDPPRFKVARYLQGGVTDKQLRNSRHLNQLPRIAVPNATPFSLACQPNDNMVTYLCREISP